MLAVMLAACDPPEKAAAPAMNPVVYFEIPVSEMDRAMGFYEAVFGYRLERQLIDGYAMALFPAGEGGGAAGALAKGDVYVPAKTGPIVYFGVEDIDAVVARAVARGGKVLLAKRDIGPAGFVAEIEDSEGNRIGLSQPR